jgi:UDP-N-acetylglucosamine diphosphorylase/glucosamine-1-phosphate N-acetyltransferase
MTRRLVVFEDAAWAQLSPLADLLPVPALRLGGGTLARRWAGATGLELAAVVARPAALAAWSEAPKPAALPADGETLAINAAALPGLWLDAALERRGPGRWVSGGRVAGALVPNVHLAAGLAKGEPLEPFLSGLPLEEIGVSAEFIAWPWDFVARNPAALAADLARLPARVDGAVDPRAVLISPGRIAVAAGARVDPLAVLDAREGPIALGRDVVVLSGTVVVGPCVVGEGTHLLGGLIGRSTIGPGCRIAGEVDECIWQGWANKRHHGFVGHSVIGEWVNLGALTTTSDLKNNYGSVRVWVDGREIESGQIKVGAFIGAHTKTGIGSLLPTGASIGSGSNLFGGGRFAPRAVPPFAWWDGERLVEHRLEPFLATARIAMGRRERPMSPADERLLRGWFEASAAERGAGEVAAGARAARGAS